MRILFVGNFIPPLEEENLHNITLLKNMQLLGNVCRVINIGETDIKPSKKKKDDIIFVRNYPDFILKFIRRAIRSDLIHFITKGYTRPGLMKLMTAVFFGKIMMKRVVITLHSEMFSIFGQLRSKAGGQQLLHFSFSHADRIICGDRHTLDVASMHYPRTEKFTLLPAFFEIPEDLDKKTFSLLSNKEKTIGIFGLKYPSLLFEVTRQLISEYLESNIGIIISVSEQKSKQVEHVLIEMDRSRMTRILFVSPNDIHQMSIAYSMCDLVIRGLSCDCQPLFGELGIIIKQPRRRDKYCYCPESMLLIKEGETVDTIAYLIYKTLMEKSYQKETEKGDFMDEVRKIYGLD